MKCAVFHDMAPGIGSDMAAQVVILQQAPNGDAKSIRWCFQPGLTIQNRAIGRTIRINTRDSRQCVIQKLDIRFTVIEQLVREWSEAGFPVRMLL